MKQELAKFNNEQIDLIKSQIAPKATDDELKLFLYQCQRTGLNPLTRQIYAIHRYNSQQGREVMTIQTSIDGYRLIAERSKEYAGQSEPEFIMEDGKITGAKVTVYRFRGDNRYPAAVGVAYWNEYVPVDKNGNIIGLWKKMPRVMLSKVAEAIALRKAFPQDLSGLLVEEEMHQQDAGKIDEEFDEVGHENRAYLFNLLESSTYDHEVRDKLSPRISKIIKMDDFTKARNDLQANQLSGFDSAINPSSRDIAKQVKQKVNGTN